MSSRVSYFFAVLMLLLAAGLRIWHLTTLPLGIERQELANVELMQNSIQQGNIRVFYNVEGAGQEGFYHSTLALITVIFGEGTLGMRILSVFISLVTLSVVYTFGSHLFGVTTGLAAMGLLTVMMWPVLLARLILVETILPLLVIATLFVLARALQVYDRRQPDSSSTVDYAVLGFLLGLGLYIHPTGLMIILVAMIFIAFTILSSDVLPAHRFSYLGFAILMMIIVAMPYTITTIRLPEFNASSRVIGNFDSFSASIIDGFLGLVWKGDTDPRHNLPGRPMMDFVSASIVVLGIARTVIGWRKLSYTLLLIATPIILISGLLTENSPNFAALTSVLPLIAVYFGLGFSVLVDVRSILQQAVGWILILIIFVGNLYWIQRDLFVYWPQNAEVQQAYQHAIGQIAHHLDTTADDAPTILCFPDWDKKRDLSTRLSATERVLLLMNRDDNTIRFADCRTGLIFADGGQRHQVIIPGQDVYDQIPAAIKKWLDRGESIDGMPANTAFILDIQSELADALGVYTTTAPASFVTNSDLSDRIPIPPPVRFGGNITWLGYDMPDEPLYNVGDVVPVTTYWRVEGVVPRDLTLFTHILSDPVTVAANRDTISVNPGQLLERDVFLQISEISLSENMLPGRYDLSVGAYQASTDTRLNVFDNEGAVRGDRIFLYSIDIFENEPEAEADGG